MYSGWCWWVALLLGVVVGVGADVFVTVIVMMGCDVFLSVVLL